MGERTIAISSEAYVILQTLEANAVGSTRRQKMSVFCVTAQDYIPLCNQQKPLQNCFAVAPADSWENFSLQAIQTFVFVTWWKNIKITGYVEKCYL
jgi:hypothetical protein